jgi:hypothetical protein
MPISTCLAVLAPLVAQTWTVDDDGGADFSSLGEAFQSPQVQDGDLLLVEPGSYAGAVMTKALTVLGSHLAQPVVLDLAVQNVSSFDLQNFHLRRLSIQGASARSHVDLCRIDEGILVENAADLVLTRCSADGYGKGDPTFGGNAGSPAIEIRGASTVQLVDSAFEGGDGWAVSEPGDGGPGVWLRDTSRVWMAGSSARGGDAEDKLYCCTFPDLPGYSGDGVAMIHSARLDLRGSTPNVIEPGAVDLLGLSCPGCQGMAIATVGSAAAEYGGVTIAGAVGDGAFAIDPPRPYLFVRGEDLPGDSRRLYLYGPAGQPAFVATSFQEALLDLAGLTAPIWLDPGFLAELFPAVLQGPDTPFNHVWTIPAGAGLEGIAYTVQAVAIGPAGIALTNSANLIVGY